MGFEPRIISANYVEPFNKGQKNDYNDAEAIAEAALRPNLKIVPEKSQDLFDLQALHRFRSRLVSRRTATINQIRAFLIEQGITVRKSLRALKNSFLTILEERKDEISSLQWTQVQEDRIHLPMTKNGRSFDLPILQLHHEILAPLRPLSRKWVFPSPKSVAGYTTKPERLKYSHICIAGHLPRLRWRQVF